MHPGSVLKTLLFRDVSCQQIADTPTNALYSQIRILDPECKYGSPWDVATAVKAHALRETGRPIDTRLPVGSKALKALIKRRGK